MTTSLRVACPALSAPLWASAIHNTAGNSHPFEWCAFAPLGFPGTAAGVRRWLESPLLVRGSTRPPADTQSVLTDIRAAVAGNSPISVSASGSVCRSADSLSVLSDDLQFKLSLSPADGPVRDAQLLSAAVFAHFAGGAAALRASALLRTVAAAATKDLRFLHLIPRGRARKEQAVAALAISSPGLGEEEGESAGKEAEAACLASEAAAVIARASPLLSFDPADSVASDEEAGAAAISEASLLLRADVSAEELSAALSAEASRLARTVSALARTAELVRELPPALGAALLSKVNQISPRDLAAAAGVPGGADGVRALMCSAADVGLAFEESTPQACRTLARALGSSVLLEALPEGFVSARLRQALVISNLEASSCEGPMQLLNGTVRARASAKLLSALIWQARMRMRSGPHLFSPPLPLSLYASVPSARV